MLESTAVKKLIPIAIIMSSAAVIAAFCLWPKSQKTMPPTTAAPEVAVTQPAKLEQKQATAEIPVGTVVRSMDNTELLHLLYGPYTAKSGGTGKVIQSVDFKEGGKKKHILIASMSNGPYSPFLSAHVFAWNEGKWVAAANYTHLEKLV